MVVDWQAIDTVMLDMDGTLLDLHYDNYFWVQYLPTIYAEKKGLSIEEANAILVPLFAEKQGLIEWYCVEYWSEVLALDVNLYKRQLADKICFRPGAKAFLQRLAAMDKSVWLVTNAHRAVLDLKCQVLPLAQNFSQLISSHDFGFPKEDQRFWHSLQTHFPFEATRTLFIDDSVPVLRSAQTYGIQHLHAIALPDSQGELKEPSEFEAIHHFDRLFPQA